MEKKDKIDEIRSTEVQEILGHIPPWTIRWGISVVFGMILILLGISWVVKYPDYIEGQINVKPKNPPIKLLAKNTGLLSALHYQNGDRVSKGSLIAVIENPISNEAISWIDSTISKVEKSLSDKGSLEQLSLLENDLTLGGIQNDFNLLREQINAWKTIEYNGFHQKKIKHLKKQIEYYSRLVTISFRKMEYGKQEFQNAEKQYQIQKELLEKKVISQAEFIQAENLFLQQKHTLESHKQSYVQNNITRTEYKKQLDELTFNQEENKRKTTESIRQSIRNIKNELANWQHSYAIKSPIDGVLYFPTVLQENSSIQTAQWLFSVSPKDHSYIGELIIPANGFGKVKDHQKVYVKLDNYPYQQYGQIVGEVSKRYLLPNRLEKSTLNFIEIAFKNPTQTTYNKAIKLNPENSGTAQIVTEDRRIIERIFSFLREKTAK